MESNLKLHNRNLEQLTPAHSLNRSALWCFRLLQFFNELLQLVCEPSCYDYRHITILCHACCTCRRPFEPLMMYHRLTDAAHLPQQASTAALLLSVSICLSVSISACDAHAWSQISRAPPLRVVQRPALSPPTTTHPEASQQLVELENRAVHIAQQQ